MVENIDVKIELTGKAKSDCEMVFAYEMRDELTVSGQLAVQKNFPNWIQSKVAKILSTQADQIRDRIEAKKQLKVLVLQKEFGLSYKEASEKVYGKALVENIQVHKSA